MSQADARSPAGDGTGWPEFVILAVAFVLGAYLRLTCLGERGLSIDEQLTFWMASATDLPELVGRVWRHAGMLPPFFLLERLSIGLLGTDELALRLPSAILGLACIGLVFVVGRELLGARAASLAGLVMALDPVSVQRSQAARPYTLPLAFALVAVWCLDRMLREPERRYGVGFALASAAMLWSHEVFLPVFAGLLLVAVAARWLGRTSLRWRDVAATFGAALLLSLPPLVHLFRLFLRRDELSFARPGGLEAWSELVFPAALLGALALSLVSGLILWQLRGDGEAPGAVPVGVITCLVAFSWLPALGAAAASSLGGLHLLIPRYMFPYGVATYLLAGWVGSLWGRRHAWLSSLLLVAFLGYQPAVRVWRGICPYTFGADDMKAALSYLTGDVEVDALVWRSQLIESINPDHLIDPGMRAYLSAPLTGPYALRPPPACLVLTPMARQAFLANRRLAVEQLAACLPARGSVAVVTRVKQYQAYRELLEGAGLGLRQVERRDFGDVTVARYQRVVPH